MGATTLDVRDLETEQYRTRLFEALTDIDAGDALEIVADRDLDPHLVRYQIERGRTLDWDHSDPDAEPREHHVRKGDPMEDGELGAIDVRDLKPQRRHEALLEIFEDLDPGEGFVLVNDHDPKPLYHELRSMHGDVIDWEYANRGSDEWRVKIVKTGESGSTGNDVVTRYDVREIPKEERHPTIHHRYGMIPEGGTMEVIAPHEPRPLHQEFRQQYGDSFTWDVVESASDHCRVQITKDEGASDDGAATSLEDEGSTASARTEATITEVEELDVRSLPPAKRHELIFEAYATLDGGEGFVLVNDHDPKPLYHQFTAEAGPEFHWEYRQRDPGEFRVLIGKAETSAQEESVGEPESPF